MSFEAVFLVQGFANKSAQFLAGTLPFYKF